MNLYAENYSKIIIKRLLCQSKTANSEVKDICGTMSATFELDSFILKFKSLIYNDSSISVSSKNGRLTLNFNVDPAPAAESSQCHQPY